MSFKIGLIHPKAVCCQPRGVVVASASQSHVPCCRVSQGPPGMAQEGKAARTADGGRKQSAWGMAALVNIMFLESAHLQG